MSKTKKPFPKAAALGYDPGKDEPPQVLARGQGEVARRIIELAQKHGVPIYKDAGLAERLLQMDVNEYIPPELFQVVAQVLWFVHRLDKEWQEKVLGRKRETTRIEQPARKG